MIIAICIKKEEKTKEIMEHRIHGNGEDKLETLQIWQHLCCSNSLITSATATDRGISMFCPPMMWTIA